MKTPLLSYPQENSPLYSIRDACGVRLARDLSQEDASTIATACNAHAGLVEALERAKIRFEVIGNESGVRECEQALTAAGAA